MIRFGNVRSFKYDDIQPLTEFQKICQNLDIEVLEAREAIANDPISRAPTLTEVQKLKYLIKSKSVVF